MSLSVRNEPWVKPAKDVSDAVATMHQDSCACSTASVNASCAAFLCYVSVWAALAFVRGVTAGVTVMGVFGLSPISE